VTIIDPDPAVVAQRVDPAATPDTAKISALARAAGYRVIEEIGMAAQFDSQYGLATRLVLDLAEQVTATEATTVVVDDKLTPHQTYNLARRLPADTEIVGRHRLILDVLAKRATTKEAQLQVERAELAYQHQRLKARDDLARRDEDAPAFMGLETYDPTREDELEDRISRLRDELNAIVQEQNAALSSGPRLASIFLRPWAIPTRANPRSSSGSPPISLSERTMSSRLMSIRWSRVRIPSSPPSKRQRANSTYGVEMSC
jgi:50S ribosomal subunit-associated GTPase HflX